LAKVRYFTQQLVTKRKLFMNSYTTSARYMRVAACALSLSLCGQTKCAGDSRIDLMGVAGAAIAGVSAIARLDCKQWSKLGLALDLMCLTTNTHAVCGGKPYRFLAIVDAGCILGLGLQYTHYIPSLTLGTNDPLGSLRKVLSIANGFISSLRLLQNYVFRSSY
jgi:hypothetical protein